MKGVREITKAEEFCPDPASRKVFVVLFVMFNPCTAGSSWVPTCRSQRFHSNFYNIAITLAISVSNKRGWTMAGIEWPVIPAAPEKY